MTVIEGEARRTTAFGITEEYSYVYRTPEGSISIQVPSIMASSAPGIIKFRLEWSDEEEILKG
ncbi:hypothetical protein Thermo_01664 [Thermoplasmatales archaeon]|nr:hypothetical protein Thermo_01664 [Thermoplasmatales archaeon]